MEPPVYIQYDAGPIYDEKLVCEQNIKMLNLSSKVVFNLNLPANYVMQCSVTLVMQCSVTLVMQCSVTLVML